MRNTPEKFWQKVNRTEANQCWEWQGGRHTQGYGRFMYQKRLYFTHRLAMILSGVEIPDGMVVMHTCDNPSCCNPAHLKVATQKDNMLDKAAKGRARSGRGTWRGRKHSPESKHKMRMAKLGKSRKPFTPETKEKLRQANLRRWAEYRAR